MDLLYFESPPGLQFLHCIKNTVVGGNSVFADSFRAAAAVRLESNDLFHCLSTFPVCYRYKNDGQHYHFTRPTVVLDEYSYAEPKRISHINWAPPFQAPFEIDPQQDPSVFRQYIQAAKLFANCLADTDSQYEIKLSQGECAVFSNRRVVHSRREFDTASGERWLKGTYVNIDAFHSKFRVLSHSLQHSIIQDTDVDYAYI